MPGWNPAYTAWMVLAVLVSWGLGRRSRRLVPLSRGERWVIAAAAFSGSMLAARSPFAVAQFAGLLGEDSWGGPWVGSGKTILFGMVGGYAGVEAAKAALGLKLKTGDSLAMPVAAGIAVGRIACFFGGCCYGVPTTLPWGVLFHDNIPRHPTQLYEAAFHALAAVALGWLHARGWFRLQLIKLYFLVYFAYRFVSEWWRPEPVLVGGLTFYQWSALLFSVLFLVLWRLDQPAARALNSAPASAPPTQPNPA